jgi:uncharacterized membrane protein
MEVPMKYILTDKRLWLAVLMILVLIVGQFYADFDMDTDAAAGMVVIAVSYIVGLAVDPGQPGWKGVLQSRKFWAAVLGFLLMVLQGFGFGLPFDLTMEQYVTIAVTIGGLIASWAVEKKPSVG